MYSHLKFLCFLVALILLNCFDVPHSAQALKCWKCNPEGKCNNKDQTGEPVECNNGICFTKEVRNINDENYGYTIYKDCDTKADGSSIKTGTCDYSTVEMTKCYCKNTDNCNRYKIELVDENGEEVATKGPVSSSGSLRAVLFCGVSQAWFLTMIKF